MNRILVSPSPHIHAKTSTSVLMRDVVIALLPSVIVSVLYYGWAALALLAVSVVSCILVEYLITRFMFKAPGTIGDWSSSILYMTAGQTLRKPESNCIRCGKCAEACPMGLEPFLLNKLARNGMMEDLEANAVQDCIECGCCLYSCPANIPLLDVIRVAKGEVIRAMRARTAPKK